jgi:hypothetical protein
MANALEARLSKLEARTDQASKKFIVVGDEAELNALIKPRGRPDGERDGLARAGGIPADATVIIIGVTRAQPNRSDQSMSG